MAQTTADSAVMTSRAQRLTLVVVCSALFLALLDSTVVSLVLPTVQRDLGAGVSDLQWIIDGYVLSYAALLLTGGALGDRFGRREVFLAGMAVFTAGSLVCALSGSVGALIAGRAVQGVGAAAITPQTLALLAQAFPGERERARAFGTWSAVSGFALLLGPVAGGAFTDAFGWHSVFLLNVPVGLLALAAGRRLPASAATRRPMDPAGQFLTVLWLAPFTYGLVEGPRDGWEDTTVLLCLAVGAVAFAALLVVEHRTRHPMLQPDFFRSRRFSGSVAVTFLVAFGLNAGFLLLSLALQVLDHADPSAAGVRLLPTMVAIVLAAALAGRISGRTGPGLPVIAGTALAALSLLAIGGFAVGEGYGRWWPLLALWGLGVGTVMSPNNAVLVSSVPEGSTAAAAAMSGAAQQVGALLGVASLGLVLNGAMLRADGTAAGGSGLADGVGHGLLMAGGSHAVAAVLALVLIRFRRSTPG